MLRRAAGLGGRGRTSALVIASLLFSVACLLGSPTEAEAQVDFVVHGEAGGAVMLSDHQRRDLGFDNGIAVGLMPGLRFGDFFGIEANVGALWFPTGSSAPTQGLGRVFVAGGGIRLEPRLGSAARLAFSGHFDFAYTGELSRMAVDGGVALEFQAGNDVGLGPYARYVHVFPSGPTDGPDAMMLEYGLSLSVGTQRQHDPVDTDQDGFLDENDQCVRVAAGDHPDPQRPGCPIVDADGDGIEDARDICPREPAGRRPDSQRLGCPQQDTDGDGVLDRDDLCATEPAGQQPDPMRPGCPSADVDGDGVVDADDVCPTTAAGEHPDPTRAGCPDGDDDGDGVRNAQDQCRTEHAGFHPDTARTGCPESDRDHDMIPDAGDACPDEPGAPSSNARRNGCPGLVQLHIDSISIERPVYFATGRDTILARSRPLLTALAEALRLTPEIRRISIEGHTDDVGDDDANMELSERRARSVMAWLVEHGIEASRLEAHGFGESRPIAAGTSRGAREENRRVELRVVDPAPGEVDRRIEAQVDGAVEEGGAR